MVLKGNGAKSYAKVLKADVEWKGNVIHVISSVLLPKGYDAYEVRDVDGQRAHEKSFINVSVLEQSPCA